MNDSNLTTIVIANIDCHIDNLNYHENKPLGMALSPQTTVVNVRRCTLHIHGIIPWAAVITG